MFLKNSSKLLRESYLSYTHREKENQSEDEMPLSLL